MKYTLEQLNKMVEDSNGGNLWLDGLTSIPEGFSPTVGGGLWLDGLSSIPEGFNPTVGGNLWLNGLTSIPEGFSPTVGGGLWLDGLSSIPEGFNPTVGGNLWLNGLTSIPEGFSPTVGGGLWLDGLSSIPEGFNPTVGGSLRLDGLSSIPEGFNPTVGGNLWLDGLTSRERRKVKVNRLVNGFYKPGEYIFCDGILTHVKKEKKVDKYTLYIGKIPNRNVVSDGTNYAHCESLREGIADLAFKAAKDRGADQFKGLDLDTEMTVAEMVSMYRIITGACRQGSENFVKSLELKERYTIREAIELTRGQYNAGRFAEFFE